MVSRQIDHITAKEKVMKTSVARPLLNFFSQCAVLLLVFACLPPASAVSETRFVGGPTQYIAALGDTAAKSGNDAENWGFWSIDPGPRGVWTKDYQDLIANEGLAC
jgi:hypothetical protein